MKRCAMCGCLTHCGLYLDGRLISACSQECKRAVRRSLDAIGEQYEREHRAALQSIEEARRVAQERTAAAQTTRDAAIEALIRGPQ